MPNSSIDLHLHSHYSDGHASPADIIRHAAEIGLKTISITDHDHLKGWAEAQLTAAKVGSSLGLNSQHAGIIVQPAPGRQDQVRISTSWHITSTRRIPACYAFAMI